MALIEGTTGIDDLSSATPGDVILGKEDNDVLAANANNITLDGGPGDDQLFSFTGDATLAGGLGDDQLFSFTGGDTLIGGPGDDQLFSLGTNNTFKFAFTLTQEQGSNSTFTDFLSKKYGKDFGDELPDFSPKHHNRHGKHDKDDRDDHHGRNHRDDQHGKDDAYYSKHGDHEHHHRHGGDDGYHAQDGGLAEKFFEKNYKDWLRELVDTHNLGNDLNGDGKIKIDINEDSPNGTPRIEGLTNDQLAEMFGDRDSVILNDDGETEKAWYSNSFNSGNGQDTIAGNDGFDTIVDFTFGEDKLEFGGISKDQFLASFVVDDTQNVDGVGGADTVITIAENTDWSLTLLEVSGHDLQAFAVDIFG